MIHKRRGGLIHAWRCRSAPVLIVADQVAVGPMAQRPIDLGLILTLRRRTEPSPKRKLAPAG